MSEINYPALANETFRRTAVGNGDQNGALRLGTKCHADPSAERIKPRGGRQLVWIKRLSVCHEFSPMRFSIPGSQSGLRVGAIARETANCQEQAAHEKNSFHT